MDWEEGKVVVDVEDERLLVVGGDSVERRTWPPLEVGVAVLKDESSLVSSNS